jgi:ribosomal protein S20
MPPQGFLNAFNSMQQLIDKLLEAGILQKNEAAAKKGK